MNYTPSEGAKTIKIKINYKFPATILLIGCATLAFAGSHKDKSMTGHDMMDDSDKMSQDMGKMQAMKSGSGMDQMQGQTPMMQGGMRPEVVPTQDGGIVVLMCGVILKYDSELNLIKKKEIDIGPEDMKSMIKRRKAMHKMMGEPMMEKSKDMK